MFSKNSDKNVIKNILDKIKENKIVRYIVVCLLIIILILFLVFFNSENSKEDKVSTDYITNLEYKLERALYNINGIGNVDVVLTIESGSQTVIAMKTTTTSKDDYVEVVETPLVVNGKTVVLMEKPPKIAGVLIIVDESNFLTLSKIQQATVSLLDIEINKIEILTRK